MTKKTLILITFIIAKILLQYLVFSPEYELHRDEFLHLDQAHHLAWGFLSVPPVTSWISCIIIFFGESVFWVRFFPALFGALTIVVVWKAIEELKGNLFALILGATCVLFSVLLRLNILFHPNSFDVLSWTVFYFVVIKFINTQDHKWLYAGAITFAIGFLNKYNIVFLIIGLFPAILLSKQRRIFGQKNFYLAVLLGVLVISPNLVWQYNHNFPVVHHLKELTERQLVNVSRLDFLKEQILYFFGSIFVILASCYALIFYEPFKKYGFFSWSLCITLCVFTWFRAKGYYAIGLYPIYISFGSVFLGNILKNPSKIYLRPIMVMIPILVILPLVNILFPNKSPEYILSHKDAYKTFGLLRWEDGKDHNLPQDFADMLGWKELAHKIDVIYSNLPDKDKTLILCDNYGEAGAINFYTKNKDIKAVSFNADYINWFILDKKVTNFIRVKSSESKDDELKRTSPFFETAVKADSITNTFSREYQTTIFVFTKPNIDANKRLKEEIENAKNYH